MDRRTILFAIGASAMITLSEAAATELPEIRGTIESADSQTIPQGQIKIRLEDTALKDDERTLGKEMQIVSNGKSEKIDFSLQLPENLQVSPTQSIVAYLEREDGWLLARGSLDLDIESPVNVILYTVMY